LSAPGAATYFVTRAQAAIDAYNRPYVIVAGYLNASSTRLRLRSWVVDIESNDDPSCDPEPAVTRVPKLGSLEGALRQAWERLAPVDC
jgi:hypothetical protein